MSRSLVVLAAGVALLGGVVLRDALATGARGRPRAPGAAPRPSASDRLAVQRWYDDYQATLPPATRPPAWLADVHVARLLDALARGRAVREHEAPRDSTAVARAIAGAGPPHYLGAMLAGQDSSLRRWRALERPLGVWVAAPPPALDSMPGLRAQVATLFASWNAVGAGVTFVPTADSTAADVHLRWATRLGGTRDEPSPAAARSVQVGHTGLVTDARGWIVAAHVVLTTRADRATIQDAALHEAGHALGLGHSPDPADLMTAVTEGRHFRATARDANTLRLLYRVRPGRVARE